MKTKPYYTYYQGLAAYPNLVPLGFAILIVGAGFAWKEGIILMLIPLILLGIIFSAKHGIRFDPAKQSYQDFTDVLGMKVGKWKPYDSYTDVVILKGKSINNFNNSMRMGPMLSNKTESFDIYLYNARHTRRIWVKEIHDRDKADLFAFEVSRDLHLERANFQPGKAS